MNIFQDLTSVNMEKFDKKKPISNAFFNNGIFQRTVTPIGTFIHKTSDLPKNLGLSKDCEFSFERNNDIPKLPWTVFQAVLDFYRDVYKDIKSEVYTLILWDKQKKDFLIHIPKQTVSGATVNYEKDEAIYNDVNLIPYLDLHSHNVMGKYYS